MAPTYPIHGTIDGPIVMIGFGSIGRGTLPLIERHFRYDPRDVHVIEPSDEHAVFLLQRGIDHIRTALTRENHREILGRLFAKRRGFCLHLSVETGSLDILRLCRERGVLYIDTVVEPWPGFYFEVGAIRRGAPTTRCARWCGPRSARIPAARRRSPAVARIPGWSRGSSRKRCCGSPPTPARRLRARTRAKAGRG